MVKMYDNQMRLQWIDIVKGIAIVCTVIGHTVALDSSVRSFIFSFHMPLFLILAGYTIKEIPMKEVSAKTWKDFKRLMIPVFIMRGFNFLYEVILDNRSVPASLWDNIRRILWGNGNDYSPDLFQKPLPMYGVGVLWFLIALFWGKLAYRLFLHYVKKGRMSILIILSFLGMLVSSVIWLPQCIDIIPVIMLFMECGHLLKEKVDMKSKKWILVCVVSFFAWIYLTWGKGINIEVATREYPYFMGCVIIAVMGSVVVIRLSQFIENTAISKPISFIGRYSLDFLCIHHLDTYLVRIWNIDFFVAGGNYFFLNEVMTSLSRVLFDLLLLILWITIIKYLRLIVTKIKVDSGNRLRGDRSK